MLYSIINTQAFRSDVQESYDPSGPEFLLQRLPRAPINAQNTRCKNRMEMQCQASRGAHLDVVSHCLGREQSGALVSKPTTRNKYCFFYNGSNRVDC